MAKRILLFVICASMLLSAGCASLLDGEVLHIEPHSDASDGGDAAISYVEAETYDQLYDALCSMVRGHDEHGYIRAVNYGGDLENDVELACQKVMYSDPVGAFALYYITGTVSRIVSYYEVEITATYKRTEEQLNSIITASSLRYMTAEIQDRMAAYSDYCAIQTTLSTLTAASVSEYIERAYYDNPLEIVAMPEYTVSIFPENGSERIVEIVFDYDFSARAMMVKTQTLQRSAQTIAGRVDGETDAEILLDLCQQMLDTVDYDTATANDGSYTSRDSVATAYGAIVERLAVGEGYAMAYKALCDEFGINCDVVQGRRNGATHAWNIVELEGAYYHIDVSACDTEGIETAFLLRDEDMTSYWWDSIEYNACDGELTYYDLVAPEPAEPEEYDSEHQE